MTGLRKGLALLLAMTLIMAIMPTIALAAGEGALWVNGVDIVAATDNTVVCGGGTATYDAATKTLTLDNVTITNTHTGSGITRCGIMAGSDFNDQELTVELIGENKIMPAPGESIAQGINTHGKLFITGSGSLSITTCKLSESESAYGISAFLGCHIDGASITLANTTAPALREHVQGIDSNHFQDGYFTCDNATLQIDGYDVAVNVPSGRVNIDGSEITITNAVRGINGGAEVDNFTIKDSTVDCSVSGVNAVAISNGQDMLIDNSEMVLTSASSNAIFAAGAIKIENGSDIDATGFYPALFGSAAVTIENSEVKAVSTSDIAIFSRGTISLSGGRIHAKGGSGFAAIAAQAVKSADEAAASKIAFSNLVDKNGAKVAFSDWFLHSGGQTRSWTTFIAKDASAVEVNPSGGLMNAVNELWLGEPAPGPYPPAETTVYNDSNVPDATAWLSGSDLTQGDSLITGQLTSGSDYKAMLKLTDKDDIIRVLDISLKSGKKSFSGGVHLTFSLGNEYAGQTITLVHKKADGTFEYFHATVDANGNVKFGPLYELSPFMLVKGRLETATFLGVPTTGDNGGAGLWLMLMGASLALAGLAAWQRGRKRGTVCR